MRPIRLSGFLCAMAFTACAYAQAPEPLQVAVAANMTAPMQAIAEAFETQTGHRLNLSFGSTGKFYAQIRHGAPYGVLLAADQNVPTRLIEEGLAVPGSQFTYAVGTLALWSLDEDLVNDNGTVLKTDKPLRMAMADPKLAPYGQAAQETLESLDLWKRWQDELIVGENIGQTYQFVATGNAQLGFVALSQIWENGELRDGSAWIVPEDRHEPIAQDAVILKSATDNGVAHALMHYLQAPQTQALLETYGYRIQPQQ